MTMVFFGRMEGSTAMESGWAGRAGVGAGTGIRDGDAGVETTGEEIGMEVKVGAGVDEIKLSLSRSDCLDAVEYSEEESEMSEDSG